MVILLLLVFNGFVLFEVTLIVLELIKGSHLSDLQMWLCAGGSVLAVCGLSLLFYSPVGQWFLRLISGARKLIHREQQLLEPVLANVQQGIRTRIGLEPLPVQLMVSDDPMPNAFAIGRDTLVISRALYETATPEELAGVMAHELGHLHNGDSHRLGIALGVSTITLLISWVAAVVVSVLNFISQLGSSTKSEAGAFISIFSLVFVFTAWFFLVFIKAGNWLLHLALLFVGRKQEYKADSFAVRAGYGEGLLAFLDKLKNMHFDSQKSFMTRLYETHPPIMLRIGEVEKAVRG